MGNEHGGYLRVPFKGFFNIVRVSRAAPLVFQGNNISPEGFGNGGKPVAENTDGNGQDAFARGKHVYSGGLQPACAGSGEQEHVILRLVDLLQLFGNIHDELFKLNDQRTKAKDERLQPDETRNL